MRPVNITMILYQKAGTSFRKITEHLIVKSSGHWCCNLGKILKLHVINKTNIIQCITHWLSVHKNTIARNIAELSQKNLQKISRLAKIKHNIMSLTSNDLLIAVVGLDKCQNITCLTPFYQ